MQLIIRNLSKVYPNGIKAMDSINLEIGKGLFGLLGPNGAGKSTLMRTIASLQSPDSGEIRFGEIDVLQQPLQLRAVLGYLPQEFGVYPGISAEHLLDYLAQLKGVNSKKQRKMLIDEVLEVTGLLEAKKQKVVAYSGGMKRRFGIAQVLLNRPKLIIVDEPTAGLDPAERVRFLNLLREVATDSIIIFSTHIVEDIKSLCRELAILAKGRILQQASPQQAIAPLIGKIWQANLAPEQLEIIKQDFTLLSTKYLDHQTIQARLLADGAPSRVFAPVSPQLEDSYFLALNHVKPPVI